MTSRTGLHVTPELMEQLYEVLRSTPPFSRWRLPHADGVQFSVLKTADCQGDFSMDNNVPHIRVSYTKHRTLHSLTMTLAHEMCHLRNHLQRVRPAHGSAFKRLADQVCRAHGFDRGQF